MELKNLSHHQVKILLSWFSFPLALRPAQMGIVVRPNIIKHCLVTKHADVAVRGQTVKTCLTKHRSHYGYKPLSKRGTHARQTYLIRLSKRTKHHENKRNVLSCLIECLMAFHSYQTRPNTIKIHQARWLSDKMSDGVWSPNISRFIWTGLQ